MVTVDQIIAHLQKGLRVRNRESGRVITPNPSVTNVFNALRFEQAEDYTFLTFGYVSLYKAADSYDLLDTDVTVIPYEDLLEERNRLLARVKVLEDRLSKARDLLGG